MKNKPIQKSAKKGHSLPFVTQWLLGLSAAVLVIGLLMYAANSHRLFLPPSLRQFQDQCSLLEPQVLDAGVGPSPAGTNSPQVVFLSVCDAQRRARVFTGTGDSLQEAWDQAVGRGAGYVRRSRNREPDWVKADVVFRTRDVTAEQLHQLLEDSRPGFFRWGVSFDTEYHTAFLEAQLNGSKIYDYKAGCLDLTHLNRSLERADRSPVDGLPDAFRLFQTMGWICEEDRVLPLSTDSLSFGRRSFSQVDDTLARTLTGKATDYLFEQMQENGSFVYGCYPQLGHDIDGYNILRHAGTLWALTCHQRIAPDEDNLRRIRMGFDFLSSQVVDADSETAYVLEAGSDELKLGGCGLAVIALTEYTDLTGDRQYEDLCIRLGNGILKLQDQDTGEFYHVLNSDLTPKEKVRTVYYDGEATFALCRLYSLTGDSRWLEAAELSVSHFIREDYARYADQWISYSINELTKYRDNPEYYKLGLENFQRNVDALHKETIAPTSLELVCCTYELYQRMLAHGIALPCEFHPDQLLQTIDFRTQRLLDNYFFPEYAMYMRKPDRISDAFFVRHDNFRTRIDDVQHSIGGLILFLRNYDSMVQNGL